MQPDMDDSTPEFIADALYQLSGTLQGLAACTQAGAQAALTALAALPAVQGNDQRAAAVARALQCFT